jgi:hypothetical protein
MQNGRTSDAALHKKLVTCGLAIKRDVEGPAAIICEPLPHQFLTSTLKDRSLLTLEKVMVDVFGQDKGTLAERAIALQLYQSSGKTVFTLLSEWVCYIPESLKSYLKGFRLAFKGCGSFDELDIKEASSVLAPSSPLWKNYVVMARTGLSLPDILAAVHNEKGDLCLLSIQVKAWSSTISTHKKKAKEVHNNKKEDRKYFTEVVANTSCYHFLKGKENDKAHTAIQANWREFLEGHAGKVLHLRIIVCWAGFTKEQTALTTYFNNNNLQQPVFLVAPSAENTQRLFGDYPFMQLKALIDHDPLKDVKRKKFSKELHDQDVEFMKMPLTLKETPKFDIEDEEDDEEEESAEETEESTSSDGAITEDMGKLQICT